MKTETKRPLPELVHARSLARDTMKVLGRYGTCDVRHWNLADIRSHISLLETALDYFDATGTK